MPPRISGMMVILGVNFMSTAKYLTFHLVHSLSWSVGRNSRELRSLEILPSDSPSLLRSLTRWSVEIFWDFPSSSPSYCLIITTYQEISCFVGRMCGSKNLGYFGKETHPRDSILEIMNITLCCQKIIGVAPRGSCCCCY